MTERTTYGGDAALTACLRRAGAGMDAEAVRDILAGVIAAPTPLRADAWIDLVTPEADPETRMQLTALKAEVEAAADPGFTAGPAPADRLTRLRGELERRGLDGFLVPRTDEHQGEYVPARAERLRWLTGFTGSAGLAVVLADRAAIFVDGRYTLQVTDEVDAAVFAPLHLTQQPPWEWLRDKLPAGSKLGYDAWLQTEASIQRYRQAAKKAEAELVAVADNPIDAVWDGQPAAPLSPAVPHPLDFAGRESAKKRQELAAGLVEDGADAVVLTMLDSIAWLLNIRGGDVPHTPLALSFAILHADATVDLFIDRRKMAPGLAAHLGDAVRVQAPDAFPGALEALGRARKTVRADPSSVAAAVFDRLQAGGAQILRTNDPCALPKAVKNSVELTGTRAAHRRDGAALTRFLAWFAGTAPSGTLTEIEAADRLFGLRASNPEFRDLSFRTISGSGSNGAIVHYTVSERTNRRIQPGDLYLVDSGAQYPDGTTDVTRTVAVGTPTAEMRRHFTLVLKGHIGIATATFPTGTNGGQLDPLARHALWQAGLDFDHGTGHGVGSYLSVHEGPHRISKAASAEALRPGMIVSNEPGYYKTGAYGIRIESLVTVVPVEIAGSEREMLGFETLTLAPIDRSLVDIDLLSREERDWLDAYHARVRDTLAPLVDPETQRWLSEVTQPLDPVPA